MTKDYVIGIVSDLHTGSRYSLFPEGVITEEGNPLSLNDGQKQILEYWEDFMGKVKERRIDALFILGDCTQGKNHKEFGIGLMTSDLDTQKRAVVRLLEPLKKDIREGRTKLAMVSGSGYHEAGDTRVHKDIADMIMGEEDSPAFYGLLANLRIRDKIVNIQHGVSASYSTRAAVMDRESSFAREAEAEGRIPHIDAFVKGHWHRFQSVQTKDMLMLQVPGWAAWIPWKGALGGTYPKIYPEIGGVFLTITSEGRFIVEEHIYSTPHIADMVKEV